MLDKFGKASLTAAAALAASAGSVEVATAADAASNNVSKGNPLTVTVVGGVVLSDFSKESLFGDYSSSKLGLDSGRDIGGFGSISIGRAFEEGSPFDWRISGSMTEFLNNDRGFSIGYYGGAYTSTNHDAADWQHFDMEIGRTSETQNSSLRIGLGTRITHLKNSSSYNPSFSYYEYGYLGEAGGDNEFLGGGPRASLEGRFGGTFGLEFAASVSALFGQQAQSFGYGVYLSYFSTSFPIFEVDINEKDWRWISDVELSGGVNYKPSNSVSLSAGYRYERLGNIGTTATPDTLTSSGPYVKASVKF